MQPIPDAIQRRIEKGIGREWILERQKEDINHTYIHHFIYSPQQLYEVVHVIIPPPFIDVDTEDYRG